MRIVRHKDTFSLIFVDAVASFPAVTVPKLNDMNPQNIYNEYSLDILIPKTAKDFDDEKVEYTEADGTVKLVPWKNFFDEMKLDKWPDGAPAFRYEYIKDGDEKINKKTGEHYEGYEGHWYLTARADEDSAPMVIDLAKNELDRPDAIVGGDIVRVFVNCYCYGKMGNNGISFGLHTVQLKEKADKPFGGGVSRKGAVDAFDAFDDELSI